MFAVFVVFTRNYLYQAKFDQVRGKLIVLHTQTINYFCGSLGN